MARSRLNLTVEHGGVSASHIILQNARHAHGLTVGSNTEVSIRLFPYGSSQDTLQQWHASQCRGVYTANACTPYSMAGSAASLHGMMHGVLRSA